MEILQNFVAFSEYMNFNCPNVYTVPVISDSFHQQFGKVTFGSLFNQKFDNGTIVSSNWKINSKSLISWITNWRFSMFSQSLSSVTCVSMAFFFFEKFSFCFVNSLLNSKHYCLFDNFRRIYQELMKKKTWSATISRVLHCFIFFICII